MQSPRSPRFPVREVATSLLLAFAAPIAHAQAAPGSIFQDCPTCPEMVVIPAGSFQMGSDFEESGHPDEKPKHEVHTLLLVLSRELHPFNLISNNAYHSK